MGGGAGCGLSKHSVRAAYSQLRAWACFACDPNEPKYRLRTKIGDLHLGGKVKPALSAGDSDFTWRVCKSFLYGTNRSKGLWGGTAAQYDSCGLLTGTCVKSPVYNNTSQDFSATTPTCATPEELSSSELVVPSVAFQSYEDPAAVMLSLLSQTIADFKFVVVDDTDPSFDGSKTPCFGSSSGSALSVIVSLALSMVVALVASAL
jgi:hypothetical protein